MNALNLRVDFAFNKLFATEENKEILISFINEVVSKKDRIVDVDLLNPYDLKGYNNLSTRFIEALDEQGRRYDIEIQITDQVSYNQKILAYWSKIYTDYLQQIKKSNNLRKKINITIININYLSNKPNYHNIFELLSVNTRKNCFEELKLHFIELQKFDINTHPIKTELDRWVNFLKKACHYDKESFPKKLSQNPVINKAFLILSNTILNKDEEEIYEARLKWLRDADASFLGRSGVK